MAEDCGITPETMAERHYVELLGLYKGDAQEARTTLAGRFGRALADRVARKVDEEIVRRVRPGPGGETTKGDA